MVSFFFLIFSLGRLLLWLSWFRIHLQCGRPGFDSWIGKVPLEKWKVTHSSILTWRTPWSLRELDTTEWLSYHMERTNFGASLVAQLVKNPSAMRETWVWSLGWKDPLEMGMATCSSILAWKIPWTVSSMGSQTVGHNWATFTSSLWHESLVALWHMGF